MSILELKVIYLLTIFVVTGICGFSPILILKLKYNSRINSIRCLRILEDLLAFATGVFLSIAFTGLLPGLHNTLHKFTAGTHVIDGFPVAETSAVVAFLLIWFLSELAHFCRANKLGWSSSGDGDSLCCFPCYSSPLLEEEDEDEEEEEDHSVPSARKLRSCHEIGSVSPEDSLLSVILLSLGLGVKTLLEGLAFGSLCQIGAIHHMGVSKLIHEPICGVVLGVKFGTAMPRMAQALTAMCSYILLLVIGIVCGMIIGMVNSPETNLLVFIMQALAFGAMIYVIFMQMLLPASSTGEDRESHRGQCSPIVRLCLVVLGFALMTVMHTMHAGYAHHHRNNSTSCI